MRETVGSLRAYFGVVGLLTVGANLNLLDKPNVGTLARILTYIGISLGCCYVYLAFSLRRLLGPPPTPVVSVLAASCVVLGINVGAALLTNPAGAIVPVVGLLINWYLYVNVRRLASTGTHLPPASWIRR